MKLTLRNLVLEPEEAQSLTHTSKLQRKAFLDLCEHIKLTAYDKNSREAAKRLKMIVRKATLGEKNRLPSDESPIKKVKDRTQAYFGNT